MDIGAQHMIEKRQRDLILLMKHGTHGIRNMFLQRAICHQYRLDLSGLSLKIIQCFVFKGLIMPEIVTKPTARQLAGIDRCPIRIVKEPYRGHAPGYGNMVKLYLCDDGKIYTIYALAEMCKVSPQTLFQRIRIYGWMSELILKPKATPGLNLEGKSFVNNNGDSGNEAWEALSTKTRNRNLEKISKPGIFERRCLCRET